jgi:integrase
VRPLWSRSPEQGRRTLAAVSQVFDYAMSMGRCAVNPAQWRIMRHRFPRRANGRKHYAAMDYTEVPAFVRQLRVEQQLNVALSPYVIEFLLLTACRGGEVVGMQWSEVDFDNKLYATVLLPSRSKHRVTTNGKRIDNSPVGSKRGQNIVGKHTGRRSAPTTVNSSVRTREYLTKSAISEIVDRLCAPL